MFFMDVVPSKSEIFGAANVVKSVQIRSFSWPVFSCIQAEYWKIQTRKNSVSGHFSHSGGLYEKNKNLRNVSQFLDNMINNLKIKRATILHKIFETKEIRKD